MKRAFIFCVEKGPLEKQAILLVDSIQRFTQPNQFELFAFAPRADHQPSRETIDYLKSTGVNVVTLPLNTEYISYPIANKLIACSYFEQHYAEYKTLFFLDTDTVFLNDFGEPLLTSKPAVMVRPVDNKGPGSEGKLDQNDPFWQGVYGLFDLEPPKPQMVTTVRPCNIRHYFNAGLVGACLVDGFFQQWFSDFKMILSSTFRPFAYQSREGNDYRCLDQVALAVTARRFEQKLMILPETYNYPIPFRPVMRTRKEHPAFSELIHVHYHKWFQHPGFLSHVTDVFDRQLPQVVWLNSKLPLAPEIDGDFKC